MILFPHEGQQHTSTATEQRRLLVLNQVAAHGTDPAVAKRVVELATSTCPCRGQQGPTANFRGSLARPHVFHGTCLTPSVTPDRGGVASAYLFGSNAIHATAGGRLSQLIWRLSH